MQVLIPASDVQRRVAEMADQIANDFRNRPVTIVGVLTGCIIFLADLVRHLDLPLRIELDPGLPATVARTSPGRSASQAGACSRRARPPRIAARRYPRHRPDAEFSR